MIKADYYFKQNLEDILINGCWDENQRARYKDGEPARSKFITQVFEKYDISKGEFPITTLRNTALKTGIKEIIWIYQKQSNDLTVAREMGINWWDDWNIGDDTIGNRYGYTVLKSKMMDYLLFSLQFEPFGRRHIMNLYQYDDLKSSDGLYPCAYETIWSVRKLDNCTYIDMTLIQRSSDYLVAGYINKSQYVALMLMVCSHLNYKPGIFSHLVQNLHIYDRHFDAAYEIITKDPLYIQPEIKINNKNFFQLSVNDFEFKNIDKITKITNKLELAI